MIQFNLFNNFNTKKKITLIGLLILALLFILGNYNREVIKSYINEVVKQPSIRIHLINIAKVAIPIKNLILMRSVDDKIALLKASGSCVFCDLTQADFKGSDLKDVDLRYANLSGADLSNTNLIGAKLSNWTMKILGQLNTNLQDANLSGANLDGVDLSNKDLTGTILTYAILSGVNLTGVDLSNKDLTGVNLTGVDLRNKDLTGTILLHANLSGANLSNSNLNGVNLSNTKNLTGVNLSGANLSGVDLSYKDLNGVNLSGVDLNNSNLKGTILHHANLSGANLTAVTLANANLSGANLTGASLLHANLSGANLSNSNLNGVNLSNTINLTGVNLNGVDLRNKDLTGVNLNGVDLRNKDLTGTIHKDTKKIEISIRNPSNSNWPALNEIQNLNVTRYDLSGDVHYVATREGFLFESKNNESRLVLDLNNDAQFPFTDETNWELGLLGVASLNNLVYVSYTSRDINGMKSLVVDEYSENFTNVRNIIKIGGFSLVHIGGALQFDSLGKLYLSVGDGSPNDIYEDHPQNLNDYRGKVLRLDTSDLKLEPEIVAYGIRNPWGVTIDSKDRMFIMQCGYNSVEAVYLLSNLYSGIPANFGWPIFEGSIRMKNDPLNFNDLSAPIFETNKRPGCLTAGVYLDDIESFLFGDFFGTIRLLKQKEDGDWYLLHEYKQEKSIWGFGLDKKTKKILIAPNNLELEILVDQVKLN
jgi:uncharacterized protein YjbI with pentapeptide repeats